MAQHGLIGAAASLILAVLLPLVVQPWRSLHIPPHMRGRAFHERDLLDNRTAQALRALVKRLKEYPTNANDVSFYKTEHEHVGEALSLKANSTCADPYMVPDSTGTRCVLAGRIDIARHYILTGGLQGMREPFESLASRVQSFGRYMFDLEAYPEARALFADERFLRLARRVCPARVLK